MIGIFFCVMTKLKEKSLIGISPEMQLYGAVDSFMLEAAEYDSKQSVVF
jgi:hypothetical protein